MLKIEVISVPKYHDTEA